MHRNTNRRVLLTVSVTLVSLFACAVLARKARMDAVTFESNARVKINRSSPDTPKARLQPDVRSYVQLPLAFEANQGQVDSQVKFLSRGSGYNLYPTPTFGAAPTTTGLVAYYKFDEGVGTSTADSSGNSLTGQFIGNWFNTDLPDIGFENLNALSFNGTTDYVFIPPAAINDLTAGTITAWVYLNTRDQEVITAKQRNNVNSMAVFAVGLSVNSNLQTPGVLYFHAKNFTVDAASVTALDTGQWYHVGVTFTNTQAKIYVNGILDSTTNGDFSVPAYQDNSTFTTIGAWLLDGLGGGRETNFLNGRLDDVRIYDRALSDIEMADFVTTSAFSVRAIAANKGGNSGDVSVSVFGGGYQSGATVKLTTAGQPDIEGANPVVVNRSRITTTFNLRGATPGSRDVVVTLPDGSTATLLDGFTIEEGGAAQVWVDVVGRDTIRLGREQSFYIVYGNRGSIDVEDEHFVILSFPANGNLIVGQAISAYGEPPPPPVVEGSAKAVAIFLPPLPARSSNSFTVRFTTPRDASVMIRAAIISIRSIEPTLGFPNQATAQTKFTNLITEAGDGTPPVGATVYLGPHGSNPYGHQAIVGIDPTTNQIVIWDHFVGSAPLTLDQWREAWSGAPYLGWATPPGWTPEIGQQAAGFAAELVSQNGLRIAAGEAGKNWRGDGKYSCAGLDEFVYERAGLNPTVGLDPWFLLPGVNYRRDTGKTDFYTSATDPTAKSWITLTWLPGLSNSVGGWLNLFSRAQASAQKFLQVVVARDPNEKTGSLGTGGQRYLSGDEPLRYAIYFENIPTATAPAQDVVVTDPLDLSKLQLSTFKFETIGFGDKQVTPPPGVTDFTTDIDLRPGRNLIVKVHAHMDTGTGLLTWSLRSIDPATGLPTEDPLAGFLGPGEEGNVVFTVSPKTDLPTGTVISNGASIVFDSNAAIPTPIWSNTLDNSTPASSVHALTASPCSANLNVQWSGTDTGSGIRSYTVYVSDNGGPFTIWQNNTAATSGSYSGQFGHTFAFYSVAQDRTGNFEKAPVNPDATVTLSPPPPPVITPNGQTITFWSPNHKYQTVRVADLIRGASDNCDATVVLGKVVIAQVSSDEPDNGTGDGDLSNDIVIAPDCKSVQLRAERDGNRNGRVYTITFKVTDKSGKVGTATVTVTVPKSQNAKPAVDDRPNHTIRSNCP